MAKSDGVTWHAIAQPCRDYANKNPKRKSSSDARTEWDSETSKFTAAVSRNTRHDNQFSGALQQPSATSALTGEEASQDSLSYRCSISAILVQPKQKASVTDLESANPRRLKTQAPVIAISRHPGGRLRNRTAHREAATTGQLSGTLPGTRGLSGKSPVSLSSPNGVWVSA